MAEERVQRRLAAILAADARGLRLPVRGSCAAREDGPPPVMALLRTSGRRDPEPLRRRALGRERLDRRGPYRLGSADRLTRPC